MKTIMVLTSLLMMPLACSKPDAAPTTSGSSAKAATVEAPKTAAAAPAPAKEAFVQKGVPAGKVVVGYLQDSADPSQCSVVTDAPAKKDDFTKNAEKLAQMMKAKVVPSCPMDNVVGTCNAGFGMLVNYSGPKWAKDAAKKDCTGHPHATWID